MSKTFHGKPLVIGAIYNPPEGSPYADPTVFDFIEETIADIKGKTNPHTFVSWEILMPVLQTYRTYWILMTILISLI